MRDPDLRKVGMAGLVVAVAGLAFSSCSVTAPKQTSGGGAQPARSDAGEFKGPGDFGVSVIAEPENRPSTNAELVEFATLYARRHGWKGVRAGKLVFDRWTPKERETLIVPLTVEALERSGVKVGDAEWLFVYAEK